MIRYCTTGSIALLVIALLSVSASAGPVTLTNGSQTAKLDWSLNSDGDVLTIVVTNLTDSTESALDLLTGFEFTLTGISSHTVSSLTAIPLDMEKKTGIGTIGTSEVDLLDEATWSYTEPETDAYKFIFNPDAEYGIIGPPISVSGNSAQYDGNGGIDVSPGHTPFAYQSATLKLEVEGSAIGVEEVGFYFGTDFQVHVVPLPSGAWAGLALLGGLGLIQVVRRRRRAAVV
jgi:hypothetical protein